MAFHGLRSWRLLSLMSLVWASQSQAATFEMECHRQLSPLQTIGVSALNVDVLPHIRRANTKELTQESREMSSHAVRGLVLGTTSTTWTYEYRLGMSGIENHDGRYCYRPRIEVQMGLQPLQISVASELPDDSCAYGYVLEHEDEHVAIYREGLDKSARAIEAKLNARFGGLSFVRNTQEAKNRLESAIPAAMEAMLKQEMSAVQARHLAFDREDERHMKSHACYGEIVRLTRSLSK